MKKANTASLASREAGKTDAKPGAAKVVRLFCIHNKKGSGCVGNSVLFWRHDGCGYTVDLDEAWKVTQEEATDICSLRPDEDFPVPYDLLVSLARRHVDIRALQYASKLTGLSKFSATAKQQEQTKKAQGVRTA